MFRSSVLINLLKVKIHFHEIMCGPTYRGFSNLLPHFHSTNLNVRGFHNSLPRCDLMEFFDKSDNWGEEEVKSGRAWTIDELRIKSNSDLHKLWFVLYKEKNMLLTMEQAAKDQVELFPSPERIDKVEISMENLEAVVRERNEAYYLLETGKTGERPHGWKEDEFGRFNYVPLEEHLIPVKENENFLEERLFPTMETVNPTVPEFLLKLNEKEKLMKRGERRKTRLHIRKLFEEFPNMDMEALQEKYPDIDVHSYKKYLEDKDLL